MITNTKGLPAAVVRALEADPYSRGTADISVTQLPQPPRLVTLHERHRDTIAPDASELVWSLFGRAVHAHLDRFTRSEITERRLSVTVAGWTVSGAFDSLSLYRDPDRPARVVLEDWKVPRVWAILDGAKPEWIAQLNLYALLLAEHGYPEPDELSVVAFLRDWRPSEARRLPDYPPEVTRLPVPRWSLATARDYLHERVRVHQAARQVLPVCTPEERWAQPATWAVSKMGGKRALKLHATQDEADAHAALDPKLVVEYRPGRLVRCEGYCPARTVCPDAPARKEEAECR